MNVFGLLQPLVPSPILWNSFASPAAEFCQRNQQEYFASTVQSCPAFTDPDPLRQLLCSSGGPYPTEDALLSSPVLDSIIADSKQRSYSCQGLFWNSSCAYKELLCLVFTMVL